MQIVRDDLEIDCSQWCCICGRCTIGWQESHTIINIFYVYFDVEVVCELKSLSIFCDDARLGKKVGILSLDLKFVLYSYKIWFFYFRECALSPILFPWRTCQALCCQWEIKFLLLFETWPPHLRFFSLSSRWNWSRNNNSVTEKVKKLV